MCLAWGHSNLSNLFFHFLADFTTFCSRLQNPHGTFYVASQNERQEHFTWAPKRRRSVMERVFADRLAHLLRPQPNYATFFIKMMLLWRCRLRRSVSDASAGADLPPPFRRPYRSSANMVVAIQTIGVSHLLRAQLDPNTQRGCASS